jgi:hypothetical protein
MHPRSRRFALGEDDLGRTSGRLWLALAICALSSVGCEEETRHIGEEPAVSAKPKEDSGPIVGQRTQKIRDAEPALKQGDAKAATTKIIAKDPITLQGNAYVSIIGRASQLSIQHALDLFRADKDRYPKDFDEFMTEIIKANNIALPKLPPYQDYAYDKKEHKLIILEYPDRK